MGSYPSTFAAPRPSDGSYTLDNGVDDDFTNHADPRLANLPTVNPALSQPRTGRETSTQLVKDGRGEDNRKSFDHLAGQPDADTFGINPRYLANLQNEIVAKRSGFHR